MKKKQLLLIGLVLVAVTVVAVLLFENEKKVVLFHTAVASENNLQIAVTSTGYVQPVEQIAVGTQVSGVIVKLHVDFNSIVKEGDLLAELDKSLLTEKVFQAKVALLSAKSDLLYAQENYDRVKQLFDVKAETKIDLETAVNKLDLAKAGVDNAVSNLHQAETNLSYADIRSPINGIVQNRGVEEGQTVASSFNTPTLFTIANNLKKMEVQASVDEADIGGVRLGQAVKFTVDSYPDDTFKGTVAQIRLQPVVNNNVVTYTVIIDAPNPDEKLFPGMTASSTITTKMVSGITIPMEALKFNPSQEIMKELKISPYKQGEKSTKKVWVKTPEGSLKAKEVKVGVNDGVSSIVEEGLSGGELVVLSASFNENSKKKAVSNPLIPQRPGGGR